MNSKRIVRMTSMFGAFSILGFALYLGRYGANSWAVPIYLGIVVAIFTVGTVLAYRARRR